MDVRALKYFSAAYEEKSLTAAARRAFVAQPSISTAISALEDELSEQLFVRHKKGVTPTHAAERLYPMAQNVIAQLEAVRGSFTSKSVPSILKLGVQQSVDNIRLVRLLKLFKESNDAVQLNIVDVQDECDIRLVSRQDVKETEEFVPLWQERYVLIVPPHHPLSLKPSIAAQDLFGEAIVHRDYCENSELLARYDDLSLQVAATASTEESAVALVAAGIGVAFLPEGCVNDPQNVIKCELKDVALNRKVGLAFHRDKPFRSEVSELLARWN